MSMPPRDQFGNVTGPAAPNRPLDFDNRVVDYREDERMVMPNPDGSLYVNKGGRLGNFDTPPLRPKMGNAFADTFRKDLASMGSNPDFMGGLGGMLQQYRSQIANRGNGQPPQMSQAQELQAGQGNFPMPRGALEQMKASNRAYLGGDVGGRYFDRPAPQMSQAPMQANFSKFSNGEIDYSRPLGESTNAAQQQPLQPTNPFEGNEQYQALMDYQKSMQPQQEQMDRMNELRTAFEGTGGFKDYRIQQMEQQLQQRQQQNPRMGMGLGGMRPTGMNMYGGMPRPQQNMYGGGYGGQRGFGGNPNNYGGQQSQDVRQTRSSGGGQQGGYGGQQGGYGMQPQRNPYGQQGGYGQQQQYQQPQQQYQQQQYQRPQQQYGSMSGGYQQNPYQQQSPQPQQFGGYGMGQSSQGGYGGYGGMSNAYAPQQYGQQSMGQPQQFGRMY